jgi:hypothetical protein
MVFSSTIGGAIADVAHLQAIAGALQRASRRMRPPQMPELRAWHFKWQRNGAELWKIISVRR